jgi:hypothetical protein
MGVAIIGKHIAGIILKIVAINDFVARPEAAAQIRVIVIDAAIDDGDGLSVAGNGWIGRSPDPAGSTARRSSTAAIQAARLRNYAQGVCFF